MQALETAVRMDPLFVIARLDLARYYDHHGNQETVEQLFKEALEVHPDSFDGHIHYGEFLYEVSRRSRAITAKKCTKSVIVRAKLLFS